MKKIYVLLVLLSVQLASASTYVSNNNKVTKDGYLGLRVDLHGDDAESLMRTLKGSFPNLVKTEYLNDLKEEIWHEEVGTVGSAFYCTYDYLGVSPKYNCYLEASKWIKEKK